MTDNVLPMTHTGASSGPPGLLYDTALAGSRLLQQPRELAGVLSSLLEDFLPAGARGLDTGVNVRRYAPRKRCVVEVDLFIGCLGGPAERRRLMIKLYSEDKGREVYENLRQLRSRGFDRGQFIVSQPLAYDPTWRLLVLDWARGESLRSLLLDGKASSQAMERAAQWLLKLHTCGAQGGRRYDFSRHLHTLALQGDHLAEAFPEARGLYSEVLRSVENRGRTLSGWIPAPTHRDFTPEHLFFDGDHLTGLDFDELVQYDPLFDVAHFLVHLRLLALNSPSSSNNFNQWAERFQASYKAGAQDYSASRIRIYQAVACLKLAYVIGAAERPSNRERLVTALLHEAQHLLKESRT